MVYGITWQYAGAPLNCSLVEKRVTRLAGLKDTTMGLERPGSETLCSLGGQVAEPLVELSSELS